jgi:hypothetical protein
VQIILLAGIMDETFLASSVLTGKAGLDGL